jgi:hypothetical protein
MSELVDGRQVAQAHDESVRSYCASAFSGEAGTSA